MHIISFFMGIVAILFSWIETWGFILAILALIISILTIAIKKDNKKSKGMEIAGFIYSIVAIIISLASLVISAYREEEVYYPTSTSLPNLILQMYDNKELSGVEVRAALNQFMMIDEITLVLLDSNSGIILATVGEKQISSDALIKAEDSYKISYNSYIAIDGNNHNNNMNEFFNPESDVYINTSGTYNSYVLRMIDNNSNEKIVGVVIEK